MATSVKPAYVNMQTAIASVTGAHGNLISGIKHKARHEHETRQQRHRKLEQQRALEATKPLSGA